MYHSTAPHEHFPDRDGDVILDVYELAIAEGTDEKHADAIADVKERYSQSMKESISYLAQVNALRDELKSIYEAAADSTVLSGWMTEV